MFGRKKPPREPDAPMPGAPMPQDPHGPQEPHRHRRPRRRRPFSVLSTVLMLIGLVTVAVLLMIYLIVPLLVQLNVLYGGAA